MEWASYRTVPYLTSPHRTVPYLIVLHLTLPFRTVPYRTVPYRTVLCRTVPCVTCYFLQATGYFLLSTCSSCVDSNWGPAEDIGWGSTIISGQSSKKSFDQLFTYFDTSYASSPAQHSPAQPSPAQPNPAQHITSQHNILHPTLAPPTTPHPTPPHPPYPTHSTLIRPTPPHPRGGSETVDASPYPSIQQAQKCGEPDLVVASYVAGNHIVAMWQVIT